MSALRNMPVSGVLVIAVIAALFVLAVILLFYVRVRYRFLEGKARGGNPEARGFRSAILKEYTAAYKQYGQDVNTPAIIAAALLEGVDAIKSPEGLQIEWGPTLIGVAVSAVVGYLAIWIFKWFLKTDKMMIFVVYTAVVGVALIVVSVMEIASGHNLFTGAPLGNNLFPVPVG